VVQRLIEEEKTMSSVDWSKVKESIPEAAYELLELIRFAYENDPDDSVRAVELTIREQLSGLQAELKTLQADSK